MERPRAPSINRCARSRDCFRESAAGGPGPITTGEPEPTRIACGQLPHAAKRSSAVGAATHPGVRSRGPIVPTFRPFARRCCRTSRRGRSLWPCRETTPREALYPLHGRRRPQRGAEAPRQPRAPTPPPQGCGGRAESRPARLLPAGHRRPVHFLLLTAAARRRPRTRPRCAGGVAPTTTTAAGALRRPRSRR